MSIKYTQFFFQNLNDKWRNSVNIRSIYTNGDIDTYLIENMD